MDPNTSLLCTIVIVAWNRRKELEPALDSVFAQSIGDRLEAIVVDNGSNDDSVAWLTEQCPHPVRVYRYGKNMGVCHGRNAGIRLARAPHVCFLDSDAVLLAPDAIERCLHYMNDHPDTRAVSGPIWFDREKTDPFCLGVYMTPDGHFHRRRMQSEREDSMALSTCFAVWEKSLLEELGGFDPWYFWGIEDLDISLRARYNALRGKKRGATRFHIVEDADVWHNMSTSGRHYDFSSFESDFTAYEPQRLYLVLAYGGLKEFFRVLLRTPFRVARVERDAWERPLSLRHRFRALVAYPLMRLIKLPWDWLQTHRHHLSATPMPEEVPGRTSAGRGPSAPTESPSRNASPPSTTP